MKKRDYSTSYCADGAVYYETFVLALQRHPEYNYSLVIWKSTDGTFDYRAGNDLSAAQITGKIKQANAKANAIIPRIIRDGMTRKTVSTMRTRADTDMMMPIPHMVV